jgi:two-component system, cell cycle sensor histidine kinase PleC
MPKIVMSDKQRTERILIEKLRLLYRGNFAVPANLVIASLVAYALSNSFPRPLLLLWLTAMAAVVLGRMLLYQRFLKAVATRSCSQCWANAFCAGAFLSGALWGIICIGLHDWGTSAQYIMLTLVVSGVTAGALTTIVTYLPAFIAYAVPMIVPLAITLLLHRETDIAVVGWLMFLYIGVLAVASHNLSKSAVRSIELAIDNEALNQSLSLAQNERDAARGEKWSTLAQLSHELRTPLNAILGFSEAMLKQYFGPLGSTRYLEYSEHIQASGRHLLTLIDEILQMARSENGKLTLDETNIDPGEAVRACIAVLAPLAQKRQQKLGAEIAPGLPLIRADKAKLQQMLLALAGNAIKYTPLQGAILITAQRAAEDAIRFEVLDTGIGMQAEDIPRALQPFERLANPLKHEAEGIGLGLPICQRLADLHGARLDIESTPGRGTVCSLVFPPGRSIERREAEQAAAAAA